MPEDVECRSDAAYGERPVVFTWEGERLVVASIINRWRSPDGKGFQILTPQGRIFELFYQEDQDAWAIHER